MLTLALASVLLLQQGPDEKEVRRLVEQLGADEPDARDAAGAALLKLGADILPLLEKAEPGDPEVKARLKRIIAKLSLPKQWAADLLAANPSQAYATLEQARQKDEIADDDAVAILDLVLRHKDCSPELTQYLLNFAQNRRLRNLWPTLVALAETDTTQQIVSTLQRLQPPAEAADAILELIPKLTNYSQVTQLLEMVTRMKPEPEKMAAALDRILSTDTDESVALQVINYVNNGRIAAPLSTLLRCWTDFPTWRSSYLNNAILRTQPDASAPSLIAFLDSVDAVEVNLAADYIAKHRIDEAAEPLLAALIRTPKQNAGEVVYYPQNANTRAKLHNALRALKLDERAAGWLEGGGPPVTHVIAMAEELKMAALAPAIAERLADKDPEVRRRAAGALATLAYADGAAKLRERIADEHAGVRADALRALGRLEGKAATRTVLDHLLGEDPELQSAAIELLPSMDLDAVIATLTEPANLERYIVRYAIAALVASTDRGVLHRVMARAGERLKTEEINELVRLIQMTRNR